MDKKAMDGLPLKYLIFILIVALMVSIILESYGIVKTGILHSIGLANTALP